MSRTRHHRGYNKRRAAKGMRSCGCCVEFNATHTADVRDADSREALQFAMAGDVPRDAWPARVNQIVAMHEHMREEFGA